MEKHDTEVCQEFSQDLRDIIEEQSTLCLRSKLRDMISTKEQEILESKDKSHLHSERERAIHPNHSIK